MLRLDKFLCDSGAGTRSQVKPILKAGRVCVDGQTVTDGSRKVDPQTQVILLDGKPLNGAGTVVLMLHKPAGYITATVDKDGPTVMELLPKEYAHLELNPVGRLDKATEGLLLFTNDGQLLHQLISPKKGVQKIYYAQHEGEATEADVQAFAEGLTLGDGTKCLPAKLEPLGPGQSRITVCEGKYHQVRRMMASRQMPVTYLRREQEDFLTLDGLPLGKTRELTPEEIEKLGK